MIVSDAQGMSYYGAATLTQRLHLEAGELERARAHLIELDLIAYQAPLTQVLSLPGALGKSGVVSRMSGMSNVALASTPQANAEMRSLAQIFEQMGHRRARL